MGAEIRARLAFGGLLLATLLAFSQLFDNGPYLGPAALGAVAATLLALAAGRARLAPVASLGISVAALAWYLAVVFQARHTLYGLPTPAALSGLLRVVGSGLRASAFDFAPVPPRPGYVVLLTAGIWASAGLGEIATFRWRQPLLASLIPIGLFSLVLVAGTGEGTWLFLALFLAALFTFWGLESSYRLRSWGRWVSPWTGREEQPSGALTASVARRMGASCIAAALVAPVLLPGLERGWLQWRTGGGAGADGLGSSVGIDLLVSLAPTLTQQTAIEMFEVEAEEPTYWRLTSLANFDGEDWTPLEADPVPLNTGDDVALYQLPPSTLPIRAREASAHFEISGLGDQLLPAAVHPSRLGLEGEGPGYDDFAVDASSGEIRLRTGLFEGFTYTIDSSLPQVSYRALRGADVGEPGEAYGELPRISEEVLDLARRWTVDEPTPFEKLVAIQERLRDFDYTLDVEREDSADYLESFLLETRAGYCQQFATAFAVLARALDYPTRVSVGFLPGTTTLEDVDHLVVRGTDAHAWPEVFFEGFGWVPFEPTPRTSAAAPSYTLPSIAPNSPGVGPGTAPTAPNSAERLARVQDAGRPGASGLQGFPGANGGSARDPLWLRAFNRLLAGIALGLGAFAIAVAGLKEWRINRLYRRADSPNLGALAAFAHFQADAADLARPRLEAESASTYAARLTAEERAPESETLTLASIYEAAEYRAGGVTTEQADEARVLARRLRRALWTSASWWQRIRRLFDPGALVARRGRGPLWGAGRLS